MEENSGDISRDSECYHKQRLAHLPGIGETGLTVYRTLARIERPADTDCLRFQVQNLTLLYSLDTLIKKELTCVLRGLQVSYQTQLTTSF
jgi:hypothetical protein